MGRGTLLQPRTGYLAALWRSGNIFMHLASISSLALLIYSTSDSPHFVKPLVSPQYFGKLGLGSTLGFS